MEHFLRKATKKEIKIGYSGPGLLCPYCDYIVQAVDWEREGDEDLALDQHKFIFHRGLFKNGIEEEFRERINQLEGQERKAAAFIIDFGERLEELERGEK